MCTYVHKPYFIFMQPIVFKGFVFILFLFHFSVLLLETTTHSLSVCAHLANKALSILKSVLIFNKLIDTTVL